MVGIILVYYCRVSSLVELLPLYETLLCDVVEELLTYPDDVLRRLEKRFSVVFQGQIDSLLLLGEKRGLPLALGNN